MDKAQKLREMLKRDPNDVFLRHALALEYIKNGNDADARQLFEGLLKDDPSYLGSYYHLAKLLERIGDVNQAIKYYEKGMLVAKSTDDNKTYNELRSAYEELND